VIRPHRAKLHPLRRKTQGGSFIEDANRQGVQKIRL
jgi:hypothetical protein